MLKTVSSWNWTKMMWYTFLIVLFLYLFYLTLLPNSHADHSHIYPDALLIIKVHTYIMQMYLLLSLFKVDVKTDYFSYFLLFNAYRTLLFLFYFLVLYLFKMLWGKKTAASLKVASFSTIISCDHLNWINQSMLNRYFSIWRQKSYLLNTPNAYTLQSFST